MRIKYNVTLFRKGEDRMNFLGFVIYVIGFGAFVNGCVKVIKNRKDKKED